jgi:hypothetical protein
MAADLPAMLLAPESCFRGPWFFVLGRISGKKSPGRDREHSFSFGLPGFGRAHAATRQVESGVAGHSASRDACDLAPETAAVALPQRRKRPVAGPAIFRWRQNSGPQQDQLVIPPFVRRPDTLPVLWLFDDPEELFNVSHWSSPLSMQAFTAASEDFLLQAAMTLS